MTRVVLLKCGILAANLLAVLSIVSASLALTEETDTDGVLRSVADDPAATVLGDRGPAGSDGPRGPAGRPGAAGRRGAAGPAGRPALPTAVPSSGEVPPPDPAQGDVDGLPPPAGPADCAIGLPVPSCPTLPGR